MHTMDRIVLAVQAMSRVERTDLAAALWPLLFEDTKPLGMGALAGAMVPEGLSGSRPDLVVADDLEPHPAHEGVIASKGGKRRGGKGKRPFWLKRPTSWIEGKKGGYGIEGDFVWNMADVPVGAKVVMGFNVEGTSMWAVLKAAPGKLARVEAVGVGFDVSDAVLIEKATTNWGLIRKAAA